MSNDPDSSDDDIDAQVEVHLPPLSGYMQRHQEADAGPSKKEWTKVWCVLQNRKLVYYKSKVSPDAGAMAEGER